ncbi:hypothetical protein MML48_9g00004747 [Holotrichia oblita]|uniref:Uncharacterized protein n=2 Tax=Holotrichia oblita TaxID=644536 RepID=A0ACB9SLK6_HOLOL|nr:hypothetical protein MML48_9g00004747 [Holotrichia oblita]
MLAKPESFLSTCDRFGLSTGSGHLIFHEICRILCGMMAQQLRWPTIEQAGATARYFLQKYRFPGVIGAVDGCHIPIKAPRHNAIDYFNRNSYHSVVLQGVCDEKLIFTDIFVGMPGRVHDARVFRRSPLYTEMTNDNDNLIPGNMHLLGDSAYPLLPNLLVPFRDNGHLTRQQHNYNTALSRCRSKIEQAFGRLKGKWRRLKFLDMDIENIPYAITAACVLHNYILRRDGPVEEEEQIGDVQAADDAQQDEQQEEDNNGIIKRLNIMQLF